jgi:hypothetical protein
MVTRTRHEGIRVAIFSMERFTAKLNVQAILSSSADATTARTKQLAMDGHALTIAQAF